MIIIPTKTCRFVIIRNITLKIQIIGRGIMMVSAEAVPFAKTGGLADAVSALAGNLSLLGHDVKIVIPRYYKIDRSKLTAIEGPMGVPVGMGEEWTQVYKAPLPGFPKGGEFVGICLSVRIRLEYIICAVCNGVLVECDDFGSVKLIGCVQNLQFGKVPCPHFF